MLQPTLDYVAVKKIEAAKASKGGILLPENAKQETFTGEVVAVGPGRYRPESGRFLAVCAAPMLDDQGRPATDEDEEVEYAVNGVKTGDVAVFNQFAGNKVKVDDVEYLILQADEVLAILPPKPADPIPESDR